MTEEYSVYEIARCIIAERLKVEESQIIDSTDLGYDLGADSLDLIDILISIDDELEVDIPDEDIKEHLTYGGRLNMTFGDMVGLIEKQVQLKESSR